MADKTKLMTATALGAAAFAGSGHDALAAEQGVTNNAWTVSIEGALLRSHFATRSNDPNVTSKLGSLNAKEHGYFGAVSIGHDLSPDIDWRLSAAFSAFKTAHDSASNPFARASSKDDLDFQTIDFDLGQKYNNNWMDARLFAGLRALHAKDSSKYNSSDDTLGKLGTLGTSASEKSEFTGIGPRVGAEFFFGEVFGLTGGVSGAILGGYRKSHQSQTFTSDFSPPGRTGGSDNGFDWAGNAGGFFGVGIRPSSNAVVTIGYKIDAWWHLRGKTNDTLDRDRDIVNYGPFLKVQVTY